MQSKFKFFAGLLVSFSLVFVMLLFFSPKGVSASTVNPSCGDSNPCIATSCGSTAGTKIGCPTVTFSATKDQGHWGECPRGYRVAPWNHTKCVRFEREPALNFGDENGLMYMQQCGQDGCMDVMDRPWINDDPLTFGPIQVQYRLIFDDGTYKCKRPSAESLNLSGWVEDEYYNQLDRYVSTIRVRCNDAPFIACEEDCPTECGYLGSNDVVPDGEGGYKECPATNSCSTYRWCFPAGEEDNSPTGYIAQAVSIDIPSETLKGKPWDIGKMIDKYCAYPTAGVCPDNCGLPEIQIPDGSGGLKTCLATEACVIAQADTGDVLGATTVVLAKTGAIDKSNVYLMQSILLLVTGGAFIYVGKEYINRY